MDELEISGKRYISTRRAAREHGYHSDYMGQLIRGKKVAGQKVGRSWYIDEASLAAYLGKAPESAAEVQAPIEKAEPVVERAPEPVAQAPGPQAAPIAQAVQEAVPPAVQEEAVEIHRVVEQAPPQPVAVERAPDPAPAYAPATHIPIHTPPPIHQQYAGGLRYAEDDSPSLPVITRMPQAQTYEQPQPQAYAPAYRQAAPMQMRYAPPEMQTASPFPYMGLAAVAIIALGAAAFASNFVSATVVAQPGKSASVQYAIHW